MVLPVVIEPVAAVAVGPVVGCHPMGSCGGSAKNVDVGVWLCPPMSIGSCDPRSYPVAAGAPP